MGVLLTVSFVLFMMALLCLGLGALLGFALVPLTYMLRRTPPEKQKIRKVGQKIQLTCITAVVLWVIIYVSAFIGFRVYRSRNLTPEVESGLSLSTVVPDQPLAGRHMGKDWRGLYAYHEPFFSKEDCYGVEVVGKEFVGKAETNEFERLGQSSLLVIFPKRPGEYKMSPKFNVTFFEPPGITRTTANGIMKIMREGATYKVELIDPLDIDNDVRGYFRFTPPKGEWHCANDFTNILDRQAKKVSPHKGTPEYEKAYRAGREAVILDQKGEDVAKGIVRGLALSCCEATAPVTDGWYDGQDAGDLVIRELARRTDMSSAEKQAVLAKLQDAIHRNPTTNWYIPDRGVK